MANVSATNTTKSIDVGSMFLMDLSVHESELSSDLSDAVILDNEYVFPGASSQAPKLHATNSYKLNENKRSNYANQLSLSLTQKRNHHSRNETQLQPQENLCNSLDRLAKAIYSGGKSKAVTNGSLVTIVEPQPPPEIVDQSSPSLSDESFDTSSSSGGSSISGEGNSLSSSYTANSEAGDEEKGSTTTREDSGVLDMKDLDSQLNNSYDNEHDVEICHHNQRLQQEKPISNDITATNLINKSANNHNINNNTFNSHPTSNRPNRPTNSNHHYNHRSQSSKRSMSASLPIQVPARQMKKDLNKLKLGLIRNDHEASSNATITTTIPTSSTADNHGEDDKHPFHRNQWAIADDFDEFLEQEYNDNHQNHYPIDKYDEEHLRADENPMKLFESIQALARSLHEDAELFGSLPPKRMLESPIRSIALA